MLTCYMCAKAMGFPLVGYAKIRWVCSESCRVAAVATAVLDGQTVRDVTHLDVSWIIGGEETVVKIASKHLIMACR